MQVTELTQNQLDFLKSQIFFLNESDLMYDSIMELWDDQIQIEYEKANYYYDISNETIYKLFSGINFVYDDFGFE